MLSLKRKKEDNKILDHDLEPVKPVRRKRKPKEMPPKPWGRRERLLVFAIITSTFVLALVFARESGEIPTFPRPLIDTTALLTNAFPKAPTDINKLKTDLNKKINEQKGSYSIVVESIDQSYSLGIADKEKFQGASLFKLPLMIAYYQEVEKGNIDPHTIYSLKYSDALSGAGNLSGKPVGTAITYQEMVDALGKSSDNTAFSIMGNIIGWNKVDNAIRQLGMIDTSFEDGITTPYDIKLLFSKLIKGEIVSNRSKEEILLSLTKTSFEDFIPKGVPGNIRVSHKYGSIENEIHDAGIVFAPRPFILVIMSKNLTNDDAKKVIPQITKIVYDWAI